MNTLPATTTELSDNEIATLTGTMTTNSTSLATLGINYREEEDGVAVPRGHFAIYNGTERVYGTDPTYKILLASNQVREYDAGAEKYVAETIFFDNPFDMKAEDNAGGYRCGKVSKKDLANLSEGDQYLQKRKKVYRITWGIINMVGKNSVGHPAVAENVPCMMRSGGRGFMPMAEYLRENEGNMHNLITKFKVKKHTKPILHWEVHPIVSEENKLTDVEFETLKALKEEKDSWNADVMSQWRKKNGIVESSPLAEVTEEMSAVLIDNDDDFKDDQIPF
tara:strand:- start:1396 stop:2232 length:837 start_codon:yes stop_codon:yes gene_type:complete